MQPENAKKSALTENECRRVLKTSFIAAGFAIGIGIGIGIGIERSDMGCGHEKLGVYPAVIEYIGWAFRLCEEMKSHRNEKGLDSDSDSECGPLT